MFWWKKQVELTAEAYTRWLRASSPQPIQWFLNIPELEQQALAILGDSYTEEIWEGLAVRITGESQEEAAQETESEEAYIRRLASEGIQNILGSQPPSVAPQRPEPSLVGVTQRKDAAAKKRVDDKLAQKKFLGRDPDVVRNAEEKPA